jgi:hypothetical protein
MKLTRTIPRPGSVDSIWTTLRQANSKKESVNDSDTFAHYPAFSRVNVVCKIMSNILPINDKHPNYNADRSVKNAKNARYTEYFTQPPAFHQIPLRPFLAQFRAFLRIVAPFSRYLNSNLRSRTHLHCISRRRNNARGTSLNRHTLRLATFPGIYTISLLRQ